MYITINTAAVQSLVELLKTGSTAVGTDEVEELLNLVKVAGLKVYISPHEGGESCHVGLEVHL